MFRGIAAYLGLAIGDALGATVEFMTPAEIRHEYGTHQHMIGGGWLKLKAGDITDDTEMSLALGNAILAAGKVDPTSVAEAFSEWMRSKPKDIGNTVRRGIVQFRRTGQTTMPASEHDAGNGACMRCLPVALVTLYSSWTDVQTASRLQAHTTHNNPVSDAGTECIIQMVQAAILGEPRVELELLAHELVQRYPVFEYRQRRRDNPSGYIVDTLQAVFQSLFSTDTFEAALVDVVNRGGDADTTGAILGMVAGALYGIDNIPTRWLERLDPNIRAQCTQQARALYQLAQQGHNP
ncbi:ADP-ribosyl-[dinitrogen reductase] hydrolase [Thiothrix unzii]|uniref:ADP-ribosyl-[dinitrogen reductase] hydrolase n=1 Tax=Thiothrix unzii TaxID=111769 RepID=A0A975FCS5_9GAMM|nr:ADP-ribosyl-[dinitrogen reductase] hydrolase [Thiothrix unzii]QTR54570.1 ADP-ribosyl-[dinitrogen reductase] hydrolase [Thiothrix unzii]